MQVDAEFRGLEEATEIIWDIALKMGLDPYPTHFEIVPASIMYEFGAYGLPGRFAHWTHGKAYHRLRTMYDYGLSKIYELVINSNPCYAFLLEGNSLLQNKLVIAHVLAHCDFFKNNAYFAPTSRQMVETASNNADRIRRYEFLHGKLEVEEFLDAVLSIQEHVDPDVFVKHKKAEEGKAKPERHTPYDDLFELEKAPTEEPSNEQSKFPSRPEKDLLLFIAENAAHLQDWQRDIIHIVRNEMLYFVPQMQTKIMNEGWASFWHARILRELELTEAEYVEFAALHSSVLSPSKTDVNPYYIGMKIFEDIEKRWNEPSEEERRVFGRRGNEGRQKILDVREVDNDVSFLRTYLTKQLVDDLDLYIYKLEGEEWKVVEKDWEKIRDMLVASMTNFGSPVIMVEDADWNRNRELFLKHSYEGIELDIEYAEKTLQYVHKLWGRTVHLETVVDNSNVVLTFDGEKNTIKRNP
ncbi:MAG: SpoVR family protein [Candidatus Marsarchaeota archaeon]|nr:SpoVR family protein [Candidatus Marsarchaeota archaeon]